MYSVPPKARTWPRLWLPPNTWLQGSQSASTGASSRRNGQICPSACWFEHSIRWVVTTPFGAPVDPDVSRIFATVSGPSAANARSTSACGAVAMRSSSASVPGGSSRATTTVGTRSAIASSAGPNAAPSSANTMPGVHRPTIARTRSWSRLSSEYAVLSGTAGTPAVKAPSSICRCSSELPERISSGRSGPRPCSSSACAIASARVRASPHVSVSQGPAAGSRGRCAASTRPGCAAAPARNRWAMLGA